GTTTPHSPIRFPPIGGSGTGNGFGVGCPGSGTSDKSIGGGGKVRCAQLSVFGVVNGVVVGPVVPVGSAPAGPPATTTPTVSIAATATPARRRSSRMFIAGEPSGRGGIRRAWRVRRRVAHFPRT